jgi:prepilin-type N-terminal cleavage/methylation domain-containing protein
MTGSNNRAGFSLVELLVAAAIFAFIMSGVAGLFIQALDIQRRASGIQKIEENAQFVFESIAREVRVSRITSGDTDCDPPDPGTTRSLTIEHPVNGTVTYDYEPGANAGVVRRNGEDITSSDVNVTAFAFCVMGAGSDGRPARLTMVANLESTAGRPSTRVDASLQTTVVSRDLGADLAP